MKFKAPPKRKKPDEPPASSSSPAHDVSPLKKRDDVVMQLINRSTIPEAKTNSSISTVTELGTKTVVAQTMQPGSVDPKIQQARNFAVAQAQQDGCKGNYKVFDSPFGNYLIPVIPTRAELGE